MTTVTRQRLIVTAILLILGLLIAAGGVALAVGEASDTSHGSSSAQGQG